MFLGGIEREHWPEIGEDSEYCQIFQNTYFEFKHTEA